MRTIEINLYKFEELSEESQQKALEKLWDLNVDYDWWKYIYDDASQVGLKLTGFDIDRGNYCSGDFNLAANEVAQNILNDHGENCNTYLTAKGFMEDWQPLFNEYMDENSEHYESGEREEDLFIEENEFESLLLGDYLKMLRDEYEWRTEKEQIIETIKCNEYEFDAEGTLQ